MTFQLIVPELARLYGSRYLYSVAYRFRDHITLLYSKFRFGTL